MQSAGTIMPGTNLIMSPTTMSPPGMLIGLCEFLYTDTLLPRILKTRSSTRY